MTRERLEEIKKVWIGKGDGLAATGNASYRMVAELIKEVESHLPTLSLAKHGEAESFADPVRTVRS